MYVLGGRPTFVDSKDINKDKSNQIKSIGILCSFHSLKFTLISEQKADAFFIASQVELFPFG
jgi:hypothetical protein